MPLRLPFGFERADGSTQSYGTWGTASGSNVTVHGPLGTSGNIEESSSSPEVETAEQTTATHRFTMPWSDASAWLRAYTRGTWIYDVDGGYADTYKVLSCTAQHLKGGMAEIRIVSECTTINTPPDEFSIQPVELGINILKHPRYYYALKGANTTDEAANQVIIMMLQQFFSNPTYQMRQAIAGQIASASMSGTDLAKAAALEIINLWWLGIETPYVPGWQMSWASFYWYPPPLNPGAYIENPITEGNLPEYFWTPSTSTGYATIFDAAAANIPQTYSSNGGLTNDPAISWLRKADEIEFQRTWFKLTQTWIGAPVGYWAPPLFTKDTLRPTVKGDYNTVWFKPTSL